MFYIHTACQPPCTIYKERKSFPRKTALEWGGSLSKSGECHLSLAQTSFANEAKTSWLQTSQFSEEQRKVIRPISTWFFMLKTKRKSFHLYGMSPPNTYVYISLWIELEEIIINIPGHATCSSLLASPGFLYNSSVSKSSATGMGTYYILRRHSRFKAIEKGSPAHHILILDFVTSILRKTVCHTWIYICFLFFWNANNMCFQFDSILF